MANAINCFDLTYEELKRGSTSRAGFRSVCFDLTYEELKLLEPYESCLHDQRALILPMRN